MICGRLLAPVHHDASPPYDSQKNHQLDRHGCDEYEDKLAASCPMPEKAVVSSACSKKTIPHRSLTLARLYFPSYFYSFSRSVAHRTWSLDPGYITMNCHIPAKICRKIKLWPSTNCVCHANCSRSGWKNLFLIRQLSAALFVLVWVRSICAPYWFNGHLACR